MLSSVAHSCDIHSALLETDADLKFEAAGAASVIQAVFRGHVGRKRAIYLRRMGWELSALEIQRVVRGFAGRCKAKRRRAMLRREAATLVQRRMRGVIGRRLAKERLFEVQTASAKAFQMCWKWYFFRKSHALYKQRVDRAAANLQKLHRGNKGRARAKKYRKERNAAVAIQTIMRKCLARMNYNETLEAASRVAAMYRARKDRARARATRARRIEEEALRRKSEDECKYSTGRYTMWSKETRAESWLTICICEHS